MKHLYFVVLDSDSLIKKKNHNNYDIYIISGRETSWDILVLWNPSSDYQY